MLDKLEKLKIEYEELQKKLTLPEVINDNQQLKECSRRHGELLEIVEKF